jgi:hypothetical protein
MGQYFFAAIEQLARLFTRRGPPDGQTGTHDAAARPDLIP